MLNQTPEGLGLGWLPDLPDFRDFTPDDEPELAGTPSRQEQPPVPEMLQAVGVAETETASLPSSVDLRGSFPPIEDQESLGSCTANAGVGLVEYFEKVAHGKHIDASRLFLYKATRNLMGVTGDTGAFLRTTTQALVLFGVPPEDYWPYVIADFEDEPTAFCYAFAENYKAIKYYRLDKQATPREQLLTRIKTNLSSKLPSMFGFTVYSSYTQAGQTGEIPYPVANEKKVGGHAVIAAGYDDAKKITNATSGSSETGALLIRNSWGTGWGDNGYGWLPYRYVRDWQAIDWWSLIRSDWVDTGQFG